MASISFTGIGSGLQVSEIVEAIVNAEKVPYESRAARKQGAYTTDISAVGALKSSLEDVTAALDSLGNVDQYQKRTITGRDDFVSLASDKEAEVGNYSVKVEALATHHKLLSSAIDDEEAVGEGTLSIASGDNEFDIVVSNTATLSEIRDAINDSTDNSSVSATIITDDSGQHLVLNSKSTGLDNAITVNVDDTGDDNNSDTAGLSRLASDATNKLTSVNGFTSTDTTGSGKLSFTSNGNSFDVTVGGADTLEDIMVAINDNGANSSVKASIFTDNTGDHLVFSSRESGSTHAITVTAVDDDGDNNDTAGISQFTSANQTATANIENMSEVDAATDAKITIDGTIVVTNSTNVFDSVIDGINITAKKVHEVDDDISKITVSEDNKNVAAGVESFIGKFNALVDISNQLGKSGENGAGALAGDSLLRGVMTKIRNQFNQEFSAGDSTFTLSQLGIRTERNGHLSLDTEQLNNHIEENPDAVQSFFIGDDDGKTGFVASLKEFVGFYTDSDGLIQKRIDGKESQITRLNSDLVRFGEKMDSLEARLFAQYNAMDLLVSQLNSTSSYLTSQLDNMPGVVRKSK
ncbi:MAG: flagellar hook-associated protein 2 [Cognaticolwellia sp.]|jgi:flagellar hook-associated protein 2